MCGIAVTCGITGKPAEVAMLDRMTQSLVHRGPDDSGHYLDGAVGLGFRRLAILDLSSAGHQPMISDDGRFVLVFNGEIFNYVELRKELIDAGYRFRSTGDSEVLLNAYRHWGADCLPKLNGMWAFIVYDRTRRSLFGSRDRFGVKPLFVYRDRDQVLFASEIKAIRASGVYRGGVNWKVASRFLIEGRLDDTIESFYEGIESIPSGSAFELDVKGAWKSWMYWDLNQIHCANIENPADEFAELFEDAVHLRMRSDVPVGVCLSGGLDSTSILCAATRDWAQSSQSTSGPLRAFCYMAKEFDESRYISDTLAMTGAQFAELQTGPRELWDSLRRMLWYQDEPVHSMTAVVGYHLMNLVAARGIRVVLNGQGADETIGGYFSFFSDYWRELLSRGQWVHAMAEIRTHVKIHGGRSDAHAKDVAMRLLVSLLHQVPMYRALARTRHMRKVQSHPWFTEDFTACFIGEDLPRVVNQLNGVMKESVTSSPLPLYLRIEDRNSMAHSVEARLPFLDYRLVSLSFSLPAHWKVRGPWNKFILREAMRGRIPESVRARPDKMGFPTAGQKWFANDLYEPMADLLSSRAVRERGIYNVQAVLTDLASHKRGQIDAHHDLFHLAEFEIMTEFAKSDGVSAGDLSKATDPRGADSGSGEGAIHA
jgi:asparagine synthase (glutamine-hydrolysing)